MLEAAENSLGVSSGDRGLEECSVDESVTESEDTRPKVIRNPPAQQQDRRGDTQNSAGNGTAETAQVTFQEPLESELYCASVLTICPSSVPHAYVQLFLIH